MGDAPEHDGSVDRQTAPISTPTPTTKTTANTQGPKGGHSSQLEGASEAETSQQQYNEAEFAQQAGKLSYNPPDSSSRQSNAAAKAHFVTPQDPVIVTSDGNRLPGVPLQEAHKLNILKEELDGPPKTVEIKEGAETKESISNVKGQGDGEASSDPAVQHRVVHLPKNQNGLDMQKSGGATLRGAMPPSHTNPLFPPLPLYGPSSRMRDLQCIFFRISSFFLSLAFLGVIVTGSMFTSIPLVLKRSYYRIRCQDPDASRPFYEEECRRAAERKEKEKAWKRQRSGTLDDGDAEIAQVATDEFPPTEGGKDPIICDIGYYARRVGLDAEVVKVQTEDGFIIGLWHIYDPKEYTPLTEEERKHQEPGVFLGTKRNSKDTNSKRKFPVLLIHGLLQSAGAYCCNDDQSLAFWLCKSGYDVWLGNNRCGFEPEHTLLKYGDPRMWAWNIRQFGVFDLPAFISRVLYETGFEKLGLVCHSQGTTQTLVALAKEQRPDLGDKISVFCALAPAAYAGPLIGKMYFKFMRIISPAFFRIMFGIHAFIPLMMQMHALLNPKLYGWLGYKVFSFLFDWSDTRWDRGLRDRMFQFSPVYVSAESMRWWLGRECFAKHKCILATKDVVRAEERIDSGHVDAQSDTAMSPHSDSALSPQGRASPGASAWYDEQAPPFALWVCGSDDLVDGGKLLRRLESGREPHVRVCHSKVIPEYEHLDVIWAMDAEDQVFSEIREVLWKTCNAREECRVPRGCENVPIWVPTSDDRNKSEGDSSDHVDEGQSVAQEA